MRMLLGGLAAIFAFCVFIDPVAAESFDCPLATARRAVTNSLPSGWYTTPVVSPLTETRMMNVGGQPHMVCQYGDAGAVVREAPADQVCVARSGGFECGPASGPAPMPSSETHASGSFDVRGTYEFDLDSGGESRSPASDFWYEVERNNETYLNPRNGARLSVLTAEPSYADCTSAAYSSARTRIETMSGRSWICVRTSEGRVGRFRIDGVSLLTSPRTMTVSFVTWR
jgi:hypothetical protein